ncbi:MAG: hypothetical protein DYH08_11570 [Actinobacteria bacterium ATB1]|nr:hypothetical protein [Actinobacteria bacterium ATB1]
MFAGAIVADWVDADEFFTMEISTVPSTTATCTWRRRNLLPARTRFDITANRRAFLRVSPAVWARASDL